jgi:hypothetical protein
MMLLNLDCEFELQLNAMPRLAFTAAEVYLGSQAANRVFPPGA